MELGGGHWTVSPHKDAGPRIPEAGHWWQHWHMLVFSPSAAEQKQQPFQAAVV